MRRWWKQGWLPALLLAFSVLAAYQPALRAGFIWDDDAYVLRSEAQHDCSALRRIWSDPQATPQYYPLVHTSFWLEYQLWGSDPFGYHLVNVLLHALAAVLLWRTLQKLDLPAAGLAAAIFALHPVCVESVAWVTERKNVLSAVFYFGAALAYLRFLALGDAGVPGPRRWRHYFGALLLFVCALLSKTVTCSLPAALLLARWWRRGRLGRSDLLPLLPLLALGAALGALTISLEKYHVRAQGPDWALTFLQRCLIAGRAPWFYAGKLVWPARLTFIYPRWELNPLAWWQWLFPAGALGALAALWLGRERLGRGPLVAVLFFGGTLLPALGFVNVYPMLFSFVADHFQYLAAIGLIALAAAGLHRLPKGVWGALLLLLGALTWRQCLIYRDLETLWLDTLAKNPNCFLAQNNLGKLLFDKGQLDEAMARFQSAVTLKPDYKEALSNIGNVLFRRGRVEEALVYLRRARQADPNDPGVFVNLGIALFQGGQVDEAAGEFRAALRLDPEHPEAHNNLAVILLRKGQFDEAAKEAQAALASRPGYPEAHNNLGVALLRKGQVDAAIIHFQQALALRPDYPEALDQLTRARLQLPPNP